LLVVLGLVSYALYTVLLRRAGSTAQATIADDHTSPVDGPPPTDALVIATATAIWGAVLLSPWLLVEMISGSAAWPSTAPGWTAVAFLALVVTGPTMALFNYGAERVPAAVSGTATGAVPALGYAFAVALGEPIDAIKVAGGALALVGIIVAAMPTAGLRSATSASA
jgi:drug/metabolite transporter (DMT)-like permease